MNYTMFHQSRSMYDIYHYTFIYLSVTTRLKNVQLVNMHRFYGVRYYYP